MFHKIILFILTFLPFVASGQWQRITFPVSSKRAIEKFDNKYFVAASGIGMYVSDQDFLWNYDSNSIELGVINNFAQIENELFAATQNGFFKSTNFGRTWKILNTGFANRQYRNVITKGDTIVLGINVSLNGGVNGVLVSYNRGENWDVYTKGIMFISNFAIQTSLILGEKLIVTQGQYGYIKNFSDSIFEIFQIGENYNLTSLFSINGKIIANTTTRGAYISNDSCRSWKLLTHENDSIIQVFRTDQNGIFASINGVFYLSEDFGESWNLIPEASYASGTSITCTQTINENAFIIGSEEGLFYAKNGEMWSQINNGFNHGLLCNDVFGIGENLITASKNWTITSIDNGKNWLRDESKTYGLTYGYLYDNDTLWTTHSTGLFYSIDLGKNQVLKFKPNNNILISGILKHNNKTYFKTNGFGFYQYDGFENINAVNNGLINRTINTILPISANIILAGTNNGIFQLNLDSMKWIKLNSPLLGNTIHILVKLDSILLAGTINGIFRSTDSGLTWIPLFTNISKESVYDIREYLGSFFIVTKSGVYYSNDRGEVWTPFFEGLSNIASFTANKLFIKDDDIFLCSNFGLYKRSLFDFGLSNVSKVFKSNFLVYPNPVYSSLKFNLNKEEISVLYVISFEGVIQKLLVNSNNEFDLSHLRSGIYILELHSKSGAIFREKIIKN